MKKRLVSLIAISLLALTSCLSVGSTPRPSSNASSNSSAVRSIQISVPKLEITLGETLEIQALTTPQSLADSLVYKITLGSECVTLKENVLTAVAYGQVRLFAEADGIVSNLLKIDIVAADEPEAISIRASKYYLTAGETANVSFNFSPESYAGTAQLIIVSGDNLVSLEGHSVKALAENGKAKIAARIGNIISNTLEFEIVSGGAAPESINISFSSSSTLSVGEEIMLAYATVPASSAQNISYTVTGEAIEVIKDKVVAIKPGHATVVGVIGTCFSNTLSVEVTAASYNPYAEMTAEEFYSDYTPATSYQDSVFRSECSFMSGSIDEQVQEPTVASYQPVQGNAFVRNSSTYYSENGNAYSIVDAHGKVVSTVYRDGGYVTLREVAAYIYAFGDIPANYTDKKSGSPTSSKWGRYFRLNNTYFSGDTSNYPYEPELPRNGDRTDGLVYYEIDIGTTGTDCDPKYPPAPYNDGERITRGAARIVYSRYYNDAVMSEITDLEDRYVFYTYNHYNDFQEYLNYDGGWGEMFGNITGGGTISSHEDYNPTPYVSTVRRNFND